MILKNLWRRYGINPLDQLLKKAKKNHHKKILICWNRGLGDIPLGLYALTQRIFHYIPDAKITYLTRKDLADGFHMLKKVSVLIAPEWKRGEPFFIDEKLAENFDLILEKPDPTRWLAWQIGKLTPKLEWNPTWDLLSQRFGLNPLERHIGVHVQTETQYAYEKNWPTDYWNRFFERAFKEYRVRPILFGFSNQPAFSQEAIIDLRGKTTFFEMLSIIKNHCQKLLVPDSGVLSMTYYLDASFPLDVVSLWADPRQGVLRQKVASPNPHLRHSPLIAKNKDLSTVSVEEVIEALQL